MAEDNDKGPTQPKHPQQPQGNPFASVGEVTIEIKARNRKNGRPTGASVNWPVPQMTLRGAWDRQIMIGVSGMPPLQQMPDIPGIRIRFDGRARSVTVYDPLALPENHALLAEVHRNYDQMFTPPVVVGHAQPHAGGPEKERRFDDQNPTELKTWLWWMRQHVDDFKAVVFSGSLPELSDIRRLPGKTLVETFNSPETTKYLEDRKREPAFA